jgi:hypothetical protein
VIALFEGVQTHPAHAIAGFGLIAAIWAKSSGVLGTPFAALDAILPSTSEVPWQTNQYAGG